MTMRYIITFQDKLGKAVKSTAKKMGLTVSEFCRAAVIEYLRSLGVIRKMVKEKEKG